MSFLKAEWRKLAIANYIIDPAILQKYIPHNTELDLWNNTCYVSLIGFMFKNTKVIGVKVPFHIDFEEVNLRFYVKYFENNVWKRGVVFIKEMVPKFALSFVANTFYNEHYQTVPMSHSWELKGADLEVTYAWKYQNEVQKITVLADNNLQEILPNSEAEFITEHYWGYTKVTENKTFEYEVTHPKWQIYPVKEFEINVDFGLVYGNDFKFLNSLKPTSVMLAEGSLITVENKKTI